MKRTFLIVLDSAGIGEAADSKSYGDVNVNTIKHALESNNTELPNLNKLGLGNLINHTNKESIAYHLRLIEQSKGKDTLTGHLEMMGLITTEPFKTYENGFPKELIEELELRFNKKIIGNYAASGTVIIEELGMEHIKTGDLILYTSEDSVLQIAAHESIVPREELYKCCEIARELTIQPPYKLGRIIARPFIGTKGTFKRSPYRKDYALDPEKKTVLDLFKENNKDVIGVGKISDVFNHNGITENIHIDDNKEGILKTIDLIQNKDFDGLCFINLNDFDSKYGHRRNAIGYAEALLEFDNHLPTIINSLKEGDTLMITADHGNDPTYKGTGHTREEVPFLIYNKDYVFPIKLPKRMGFDTIGCTIANIHNLSYNDQKSIKNELI